MTTFLAILTGCATGIAAWALCIAYSAKDEDATTFRRLLDMENTNLDWRIACSKERKAVTDDLQQQLNVLGRKVRSIEEAITSKAFAKIAKDQEAQGFFTISDLSKVTGAERYEKLDGLVFTYDPDTMQFELVKGEVYVKK